MGFFKRHNGKIILLLLISLFIWGVRGANSGNERLMLTLALIGLLGSIVWINFMIIKSIIKSKKEKRKRTIICFFCRD